MWCLISYLVQFLLWDLLSDGGVVPLKVQHKPQQAALGFVAHLLGKTPLHVRRLSENAFDLKFGF